MRYANRIVATADVDPATLTPHPQNWRAHPASQLDALDQALGVVGWVTGVVVNQRTNRIVDGHARVEMAIREGAASVPVTYVDLDDDEERLVLATLDPIGALAGRDDAVLAALLAEVQAPSGPLADLLDSMAPPAETNGHGVSAGSEDGESQRCPACGHEWLV